MCMHVSSCIPVDCSLWTVTLWTLWTPLSVGFSRQKYQSRRPCSPPGDLPDSRIEPMSLISPALADRFFTTSTTWEAHEISYIRNFKKIQQTSEYNKKEGFSW